MLPVIFLVFAVLFINIALDRRMINKWGIPRDPSKKPYVSKTHKTGEQIFYPFNLVLIAVGLSSFSEEMLVLLFLGPGVHFAFRTIMNYRYDQTNRYYLLPFKTVILFLLASLAYAIYIF